MLHKWQMYARGVPCTCLMSSLCFLPHLSFCCTFPLSLPPHTLPSTSHACTPPPLTHFPPPFTHAHLHPHTYTPLPADLPSQETSLVLRLNGQFPGDVGCFCVFFLNFLRLQPGECLFLAPNEPHAYIYGGKRACTLPNPMCPPPNTHVLVL